jgi:hypothetical protein
MGFLDLFVGDIDGVKVILLDEDLDVCGDILEVILLVNNCDISMTPKSFSNGHTGEATTNDDYSLVEFLFSLFYHGKDMY